MHAGGGFFGDALDLGQAHGVPGRIDGQLGLDGGEEDGFFFRARLGQDGDVLLGTGAEVQQQGGVAAVVEDHIRIAAVGPFEDAVGVIPVIDQGFALDGEDRDVLRSDGSGSVILSREDVARGPADFGAERGQRLDQHGGLDGHVQRAGDARALQRLRLREFLANGHQAGHFGFGNADFLATPVGKGKIGNNVVFEFGHSKLLGTVTGRGITALLLTGGPLRPAGLISERRFKPSLGAMLIIVLLQRPSVGCGL
ncbi:hypothetical protein SDC9_143005 [bioreactor metagenome]|uniref:Uncharacterized protein n=1 Tax=bioreactor metagenome TaxID=1076179 RepID=A0A645E258_9ZZZZ